MELCSADATITDELAEIDENIAQLIRELGGSVRGYRSGRRGKIMNLVSEIHSAPRVTNAVKLMPSLEVVPGFALDLSGEDENRDSWDFTMPDMRAKARAFLLPEKPFVLIGSPPCTSFWSWPALNVVRL